MRPLACALAVAAALAAAAPALALDLERVEAIGAAPLRRGERPTTPPYDEAVRLALSDAVRRTAAALVPGPEAPSPEQLDAALGDDPFAYAASFQIVEDRGERAALFHAGEDVEREYVVVVEAQIDRDRIRDGLATAGLATTAPPTGSRVATRTRIALEQLTDYGDYQRFLALLGGVGVRASPVEASAGRMVLEVDSDRGPEALLAALRGAAPPDVVLVPLQVERGLLRLRVESAAGAAAPGAPGTD